MKTLLSFLDKFSRKLRFFQKFKLPFFFFFLI
ncbi:hypothetical protein N403_02380 [Helicobacter pylori FD430]|nr:hypothetical protein N403_02380 [Helicobacter pylori FD430]